MLTLLNSLVSLYLSYIHVVKKSSRNTEQVRCSRYATLSAFLVTMDSSLDLPPKYSTYYALCVQQSSTR